MRLDRAAGPGPFRLSDAAGSTGAGADDAEGEACVPVGLGCGARVGSDRYADGRGRVQGSETGEANADGISTPTRSPTVMHCEASARHSPCNITFADSLDPLCLRKFF